MHNLFPKTEAVLAVLAILVLVGLVVAYVMMILKTG